MEKAHGLGRLSPTARLVVFFVLSTLFTFSFNWVTVLVSLFIGIGLLVAGRKYPRAAIIASVSAGVLTFLGNGLFAKTDAFISFLFIHISTSSLLTGLLLGLRIIAMILPAIAFIAVTPLPEYLTAFRGLHIPAAGEMYLMVVLRYVDILWYEIQISMKAMAIRGVNWEGHIREKIPAFRSLMLPLIFRILEHVDGQSLAIDNRGGIKAQREGLDLAEGKSAISVKNVYVHYEKGNQPVGKFALSDFSLEVERGSTMILLGHTGAGKSSALLLCTGLIPHSIGRMKGKVELFGTDTRQIPLSKLGRLSRIVLTGAVQGLVGLKVRDELEISLRVSSLTQKEHLPAMIEALEIVGLDETFLDRLTLGLSGGEMQRVALASAIVAHPAILVLDDVTMQLDPRGKREVIHAVQSLMEERITTVMSDAHVGLLEEVGDQFTLLKDGAIANQAPHLTARDIAAAGLRVPQLWRLGEAIGLELPTQVEKAAYILRERAQQQHPHPASPARPQQNAIVEATGLTYGYPNGPLAVKGLNITFYRGEFVAILGSNGSGKSTLALLLAGAMLPSSGQILIEGRPYDRKQHRGYVGYVFQEPGNQMVTMKVADELAFGPQQLGWDENAIKETVARELERFNLDPNETPMHLAPAVARKVSIAATLTMKPKMIILDEPTNNLDVDDVEQLMQHLKKLQEEGTSVVLITHDIEVALQYAERLVIMSDGAILIDGETREVISHPEILTKSDVVVTPVVELSLALWPDQPPALTVDELAPWLMEPVIERKR